MSGAQGVGLGDGSGSAGLGSLVGFSDKSLVGLGLSSLGDEMEPLNFKLIEPLNLNLLSHHQHQPLNLSLLTSTNQLHVNTDSSKRYALSALSTCL